MLVRPWLAVLLVGCGGVGGESFADEEKAPSGGDPGSTSGETERRDADPTAGTCESQTCTYEDVAVGGTNGKGACVIRTGGDIRCWNPGTYDLGVRGPFVKVALGVDNWMVCALDPEGDATCWSMAPFADVPRGRALPMPGRYRRLAIGAYACGIDTAGSVRCFSWVKSGEAYVAKPQVTFDTKAYDEVVTFEGTVVCARVAATGVIECTDTIDRPGEGRAVGRSLTYGSTNYCYLDDESMPVCADYTSHGAPGSTAPRIALENVVRTRETFVGCGLDKAGQLHCFDTIKRAGAKAAWDALIDTRPTGTFKRVAVGLKSGCAIRTDGTLVCWGEDSPPPPPP